MRYTFLFFLTMLLYEKAFPSSSQDSIIFHHIKKNKKITLPLGKYPMLLKNINGERKNVILIELKDSTLIYKTFSFKQGERKIKRMAIHAISNDTSLTEQQVDSLKFSILYSLTDTIAIKDIKKIKFQNSFRPEMNRQLKANGITAACWFPTGLISFLIFPFVPAFIAFEVSGIAIITWACVIDKETITLKNYVLK